MNQKLKNCLFITKAIHWYMFYWFMFIFNLLLKTIHWCYYLTSVALYIVSNLEYDRRCTLVGNKVVDLSDVVGTSPFGTAPTTSSFLTTGFSGLSKDNCKTRRETFRFGVTYIRGLTAVLDCWLSVKWSSPSIMHSFDDQHHICMVCIWWEVP